jgi:hypothetical protein
MILKKRTNDILILRQVLGLCLVFIALFSLNAVAVADPISTNRLEIFNVAYLKGNNEGGFSGSPNDGEFVPLTGKLRGCQKLLEGELDWKADIIDNLPGIVNKELDESPWRGAWFNLVKSNKFKGGGKLEWVDSLVKKAKKVPLLIRNCAILATHAKFVDYTNTEETTPGGTKTSSDGTIKCETAGAITQDYGSCLKVIKAVEGMKAAKAVHVAGETVAIASKQSDEQAEIQQQAASGQGLDQSRIFDSQANLKGAEADSATRLMARGIAAAGFLASVSTKFVTQSELDASCEQIITDKEDVDFSSMRVKFGEALITFVEKNYECPKPQAPADEETCDDKKTMISNIKFDLIDGDSIEESSTSSRSESRATTPCVLPPRFRVGLLKNQQALEASNSEALKEGVEAVVNAIRSHFLKKQKKTLEDLARQFGNNIPVAPQQLLFEDFVAELCAVDPSQPECLSGGLDRGVGFAGNSFSIGTNQFATTGPANIATGNRDENAAVNDDVDRPEGVRRNAVARGLGVADKGGGLENAVAAGSVKASDKGNPATAGASAGSAGLASGGASGGPAGAAAGQGAAAGARKRLSYGGAGGSLTYRGSGKARKAKKSKVGNPFKKLFGKKKRNNVLRYPAGKGGLGNKKDSIWNMVSRAHINAYTKKKLLEYKQVK